MQGVRFKMGDFGFAFNDYDFSDRVLHLEILPDDEAIDSGKNLKEEKYHEWFSSIYVDQSKDSKSYDGAKVVKLHINSVVLAAESLFFYTLFKNGMRESQHKNDVSLRISASEEATFMDLLNFMYGNKLSANSVTDLVDLLIAADKFEVTSCMRYSIQMLLKLSMSLEYAVLYLELPSSVLVSEIVQPLIDEARKYVVGRFKDLIKSQDEAIELPLSALEVVLGSEGLQVDSEDDVFDFILKWAREHYPELEDRQKILTSRLMRFMCFSNMGSPKLKEVLACPDFEHEQVSKLVVEALFSKVELSCGQHVRANTNCHCSGRVYNCRFAIHTDICVVYFDLKKKECADLFSTKRLDSPHFCLGGKRLFLSAQYMQKEDSFGLFLRGEEGSETCTVDFEFEVKKKSSNKFESKGKAKNLTLFKDRGWGVSNLLKISWTEFMSDNNNYFIDGILHLRAEINIVNNS